MKTAKTNVKHVEQARAEVTYKGSPALMTMDWDKPSRYYIHVRNRSGVNKVIEEADDPRTILKAWVKAMKIYKGKLVPKERGGRAVIAQSLFHQIREAELRDIRSGDARAQLKRAVLALGSLVNKYNLHDPQMAQRLMMVAKALSGGPMGRAGRDVEGVDTEYQEYFRQKLKERGIKTPTELDDIEKRKFFEEVDKGWKGKDEAAVQGAPDPSKKLMISLKKLTPRGPMAKRLMKRFDKIVGGRRFNPSDLETVLQKLHQIYVPVEALAKGFLQYAASHPGKQQDWEAKLLRDNLERRKDLGKALPSIKSLYDSNIGGGPLRKNPYHKVRAFAFNMSGAIQSYLNACTSISEMVQSASTASVQESAAASKDGGSAYQQYFQAKLKQRGVKSPHELSDEDKKKFFTEIENGWKGKDEKKAAGFVQGGHHQVGKDLYVDTAFVNNSQIYPGAKLRHMGMGEFSLETPDGTIEFDRMRGKDFKGQSGRSHKVYGPEKAVAKLLKLMESKGKSKKASVQAAASVEAAAKPNREKDLKWVENAIKATEKSTLNEKTLASRAQALRKIADAHLKAQKSYAKEYEKDAKDFAAQGMKDHAKNAQAMVVSFNKWVAHWEKVKAAVSTQYGELVKALLLAKKVLTRTSP